MWLIGKKEIDAALSERKCIVTGNVHETAALLRFARAPDSGEVVPDPGNELPGRGLWIFARQELVARAVKRNLFARAFRDSCVVAGDLDERVAKRLDELALNYLSLARKAGQAVQGFEKVAALIASGRVQVLIGAHDGSADGRDKLQQRLRAVDGEAVTIEFFSSGQLGLALGRTNVIHAAMAIGGLAGKFVAAAHRAEKYRDSADQSALEFKEQA